MNGCKWLADLGKTKVKNETKIRSSPFAHESISLSPPMPVGGQLFLEISNIPDIVYIMMQKCWV